MTKETRSSHAPYNVTVAPELAAHKQQADIAIKEQKRQLRADHAYLTGGFAVALTAGRIS